ncbi:MAG: hypothetical protein JO041_08995 [Acidobacteria bacterium]|nr:hypothetical protein [Acidobacteriota bacterium]
MTADCVVFLLFFWALCNSGLTKDEILWILGGILGGIVLYHAVPIIFVGLWLLFQSHPGWTLGTIATGAFGGPLAWMAWADHKDNKAIRAGERAAFDRRVDDYVRVFGYDREKAIAVTTQILNGTYSIWK